MQRALKSLPGVATVKVDIDSGTTTVSVNPDEFEVDKAIEALVSVGFPDSSKKE